MKKWLLPVVFGVGILLVGCSKSYDQYLEQASEFQQAEQYDQALTAFDNAIKKAGSPQQRIAADIKAAEVATKNLKDNAKANHYFNAALADAGDYSAGDLRDLAQQALADQANNAAIAIYDSWFKRFPDNPNMINVKYEYAEVYHKNVRDLKRAITAYEDVVSSYPDSEQAPKALFSIGYIYANEMGQNDSAAVYYSQFLEKYPDHEMAPSVEFELKYLGKSLEEIPELQHLLSKTS